MFKVELYEHGKEKITLLDFSKGINNLSSCVLNKEEDAIDTLTMTINNNFIALNKVNIKPFKTLCKVTNLKENKIEFIGRVLSPESSMNSEGSFNNNLVFEGALSFLKDTMQKYSFEFDKTPSEILMLVINHHNSEVINETYKKFVVGTVNVPKNIIPNDENYNEELKYFKRWDNRDTYETLTRDAKEKYGGHFTIEYKDDSTVINYLVDTSVKKGTVINLGRNLKTVQMRLDPTDVITRVKPLGITSESANGDEIPMKINEVNNGSAYIDIPELQKIFGIQTGIVDFPEAVSPTQLKELADKWILEQNKKISKVSIQLDALDLSLLKLDSDNFDLYGVHRVVVPPMKINDDLKIIAISIDLMNPQNKSLTIGEKELTLKEFQNKNISKVATNIITNEMPQIIEVKIKPTIITQIEKLVPPKIKELKDEFDKRFQSEISSFNTIIGNIKKEANDLVISTETRMNEQLSSAKSDLSGQISNSYSSAVQAAELKAKELDAVITQTVVANKQAADKTMGEFNTALGSTNNKVGTIEQNVIAAQGNISTLMNTTNAQQTAIQNAQGDISGLKTTVGGHTASISNLDNQIKLTATKTEVTDAVNALNFENRNLIEGTTLMNKDINKTWGGYDQLHLVDIVSANSKLKVGDTVTLSFDVQMTIGTYLRIYDALGQIDKTIGTKIYSNIGNNKQRLSYTTTLTSSTQNKTTWMLGFYNNNNGDKFTIENIKLELGSKATPYSIAPEDLEANITKNETSIQVNSDEIAKRVTQTEFNTKTGEIEQTANTAKSTADSNSQTITTVKGNVDALSQWKADKGTAIEQTINSVTNKAWLTDINPITKRVETAEASITTNANEILKRVTKTEFDTTTGRIEGVANTAKSTATSNTAAITTVSGRVGTLEKWRTDKGSQIDQTIDAVTTKVWQNDIDKLSFENRNLLKNSKYFAKDRWLNYQRSTIETIKNEDCYNVKINGGSELIKGFYMVNELKENYVNEFVTLSIKIKNNGSPLVLGHNWLAKQTDNPLPKGFDGIYHYSGHISSYAAGQIQFRTEKVEDELDFDIYWIKIEKGSKATPYSIAPEDAENRMTEIKQTADGALTKATTIGNDYVKQSAVLVQSDGVLIGSKKVSGAEMASAISVTPSSVDIITKAMRITGDMAIAGDIKSLSLSTIYADIANLRASVISADSVTSVALKVDTALMDKLNVNSILTNKLLADTAMINAIKSNAITAVRGDIAYLKANIITADSITSTALKADLSMIDKLFSESAHVKQLTTKTAFIESINTIDISATKIKGGELRATNDNIVMNLDSGAFVIKNSTITYTETGNALRYSKNGWTGGITFQDDPSGYPAMAMGSAIGDKFLNHSDPSFTGVKSVPTDQSLQLWGGTIATIESSIQGAGVTQPVFVLDIDQNSIRPEGHRAIMCYKYKGQIGSKEIPFENVYTNYLNKFKTTNTEITSPNGSFGIFMNDTDLLLKVKGKYFNVETMLTQLGWKV